jgi:hypothetical protein
MPEIHPGKKVTSDRLRGATGRRSMLIIVEVDFYARFFCRFFEN